MFEWYLDLSRLGKILLALSILGGAGIAYGLGYFWPWAWGIGVVLLIAAFSISDD